MFYSNISIHIEINNQFNKIFLPFAKELYARIINLGLNCQMFWGYKESNSTCGRSKKLWSRRN